MSHGAGKTRRQKHWDLFDPKSQHYKSHTKNVIGSQERERDERLVLKVNNVQEIYEKALLACLYLGHQVRSYFILSLFSSALKSPIAVQNALNKFFFYKMSDAFTNAFGVQLDINHPKSPLSSDFNDDFYFPKTLNDNSSVCLLIKSFVSDNWDPKNSTGM